MTPGRSPTAAIVRARWGRGSPNRSGREYPAMYEEYRRRCKAEPRQFNLGECWLWKADDRPWVFNLGTQEGYWRGGASHQGLGAGLTPEGGGGGAPRGSSNPLPPAGGGDRGGCGGE